MKHLPLILALSAAPSAVASTVEFGRDAGFGTSYVTTSDLTGTYFNAINAGPGFSTEIFEWEFFDNGEVVAGGTWQVSTSTNLQGDLVLDADFILVDLNFLAKGWDVEGIGEYEIPELEFHEWTARPLAVVSLPGSLALLLGALAGLVAWGRKR